MAEASNLNQEIIQVTTKAREAGLTVKDEEVRRTEALSLHVAGISYEAIGKRLGISERGARDLVNRTLERAQNRSVEELRSTENARLDRALSAIWSKVLEGDLRAIEAFLKISSRRAQLNGLDAPKQLNVSMTIRDEMVSALDKLESLVIEGEIVDD